MPDANIPIEAAAMAEALAAARAEVDALREELEETNRGVLALYAELDAQADDLRQATELKSRFLAYMSHEFRTPIGSVLSIARLLLDRVDGPLTDEQERQVKFIQETSVEFSDMVNDLLDLAKVEAGRIDISPDWFEMVDLFSTLRGMFKPVLTNPDLLLVFEEPQDVPKLFSDDRKLAQILRNFISNALKFTAKGEVRVSARREEGGMVVFSVADTGIGIASDSTTRCSRTSTRSIRRSRSACAARDLVCRSAKTRRAAGRNGGADQRTGRGLGIFCGHPGRRAGGPAWLTWTSSASP
jgi:signal transduction histidine kinase